MCTYFIQSVVYIFRRIVLNVFLCPIMFDNVLLKLHRAVCIFGNKVTISTLSISIGAPNDIFIPFTVDNKRTTCVIGIFRILSVNKELNIRMKIAVRAFLCSAPVQLYTFFYFIYKYLSFVLALTHRHGVNYRTYGYI